MLNDDWLMNVPCDASSWFCVIGISIEGFHWKIFWMLLLFLTYLTGLCCFVQVTDDSY